MSHDIHRQLAWPPPASVRATSGYISGGLIVVAWLMMIHVAAAQTHKLRVHDPAVARALVAQGGKLVADYDGFQVIETDQTSLPGMSDESVQVVDHFDSIQLNGRHLGTRAREVQSMRTSLHIPSGKGLHLVHFAGPVKPEWRQSLEKSGAKIISYLPHNAFLVYGDAPALISLQSWARAETRVQWDGRYLPEYKIHPRARTVDGKGNPRTIGTATFAIQLVADADVNADTLQLIDRLKLSPIRNEYILLQYHNVIVDLPADRLEELAAMPDVISIQPYFTPRKRDERQDQILAGNVAGGVPTGPGYLAWLASKGFTQAQFDVSGFAVDVSDSGIDNGTRTPGHFALYPTGNVSRASRILYNRLEGTPSPGSTLRGCDGHGTLNAHIVAGFSAFNGGFPHADSGGYSYGLGVCPFVTLGSSVLFDPDDFTFPNYAGLQTRAWNSGARISNNSWGSGLGDGVYDTEAQTYDALVRDVGAASSNRQMVIVFSAGNEGPASVSVGSPGTAKNVITVGSANNVRSLSTANGGRYASGNDGCDTGDAEAANAGSITSFSSRGPCEDGRMKPDLVAPGTHIAGGVAQAGGATTNGTGNAQSCFNVSGVCALTGLALAGSIYNYFPLGQEFYTVSSGTSHAAPAVSGACALLRQYFINHSNPPPSPAMTKACLLNSARYLTGTDANDTLWSASQGMGELDLSMAFDGVPCVLRDQQAADKLTITGQSRTFSGTVLDPAKPFRVTVAWTDVPGSTIAAKALVNDLDLTVNVGGNTYKGNVFSGALSTTGGAADSLNNVESVFLPAGVTGTYSVTISAANIAGDALNTGTELPQQDFGLIIHNADLAPAPVITVSGYSIIGESCAPANGVVDSGETVTLEVSLRNVGSADTTNLVATLLAANGVTSPGAPQAYGVLAAGGGATMRTFSFTATGSCGAKISPSFQLSDGTVLPGAALMSVQVGSLSPVFLQNFDGATAPALPVGWSSAKTNYVQSLWVTSKTASDSPPNAAFIGDPTTFGVATLTSPVIALPTGAAQLSFRNKYDLERVPDGTAFDGGLLEIKVGSGTFTDIITAGGSFVSGGYNAVLDTGDSMPSKNPLAGRPAWSGNSGGFITTTVNLPALAEGQSIQLRWRCGFDVDNAYPVTGWMIDSVAISSYWCCPGTPPPVPFVPKAAVYNGLFYEAGGVQYLASGAFTAIATASGAYSGTLQLGASKFKISGLFDGFGVATNVIPRTGTNPITLVLRVDTSDNRRLTGTVNGGTWVADLAAEQASFNAKINPAPFAGVYTVSLPGSGNPADATRPSGDGYATISVSTAGSGKLAGVLADGTKLSGKVTFSAYGHVPIYVAFTGGQVLGWLAMSNTVSSDLDGWFHWIKLPSVSSKLYPAGFNWSTNAVGSRLQPTAVPPLNFTNGTVVLTGANLSASITNQVRFVLGKFVNQSSNALTLTVTTSKGLFKGTVVDPVSLKSIPYQGVLLQKQNYGSGYFLGTNQSGRVYFGP